MEGDAFKREVEQLWQLQPSMVPWFLLPDHINNGNISRYMFHL